VAAPWFVVGFLTVWGGVEKEAVTATETAAMATLSRLERAAKRAAHKE
jgi:hypothetical protein